MPPDGGTEMMHRIRHTQTHSRKHTHTHTVLTVSKWAAQRPGPRDTHRDPPPSVSSISVRAANDSLVFSITENAEHAKQAHKHGKHEKCEGV